MASACVTSAPSNLPSGPQNISRLYNFPSRPELDLYRALRSLPGSRTRNGQAHQVP
jgi:hypothetical protein